MHIRRWGVGLSLMLALAARAQAGTVYVNSSYTGLEEGTLEHPYNTIQEGVNGAVEGDVVQVADGWYVESVSIYNRTNLTLTSSRTWGVVIAHDTSSKFSLFRSSGITIQGFIVYSGQNGIRVDACSNICLEGNAVLNVTQSSAASGGAFWIGFSSAQLLGNIVQSCYGGQQGGGARIYDSDLVIQGNHFVDCNAWNAGGGLFISSGISNTITISSNYFGRNRSIRSGAIHIEGGSQGNTRIERNIIEYSGSSNGVFGGAILLSNTNPAARLRISNNVVAHGYKPYPVAESCGLYVLGAACFEVRNNVFYDNDYAIYSTTPGNVAANYNLMYLWNAQHEACLNVSNRAGTVMGKDPLFVADQISDYRLRSDGSPCINAGHPAVEYNDPDGSRNDIGVFSYPFPMNSQFLWNRWLNRTSPYTDNQKWLTGDFDGDGRADMAKVYGYASGGQTLASIDVFQSQGDHLVFNWTTRNQGPYSDSQKWLTGDFNGDGITDLAVVFGYMTNGYQMTGIDVHPSTGNSFRYGTWCVRNRGGYSSSDRWLTGDFNKDGKTDLARLYGVSGNGSSKLFIGTYLSTGNDFVDGATGYDMCPYADDSRLLSGDFNRDGFTDFVRIFPYWRTDHWEIGIDTIICLTDGGGFHYVAQTKGQGWWSDQQKWMAGDFDGDGACDLAKAFDKGNGETGIDVHHSRGQNFVFKRWGSVYGNTLGSFWNTQKWSCSDFNGDGVMDAARVFGESGSASIDILVSVP
jgi:hypothetical protein